VLGKGVKKVLRITIRVLNRGVKMEKNGVRILRCYAKPDKEEEP
jgi:hypothetical protein